ncbi:MAG: C45 family autoproteolytic acyltransferase/hydrolase [Candidatus Hermodarchaeota archaeon]
MKIIKDLSKIRVINLEGSPNERGYLHGETLKFEIIEIIERYKYSLQINYKKNPEQLINYFLSNTNFLAAVKKWSPHLIEEIEGIAEGVGVEFNEIFAMQMVAHDEGWWFFQNHSSFERCSSLGCFKSGDQPVLIAQNLDLPNIFEGLEVLFHIKNEESSLESYVLSHAGFLGEFGVNNQSVAICCNSLSSYLNNSPNGLPFTYIIRSVLEKSNLKEAEHFLKNIHHASAQNYIIGGKNRIVCYECSANKIAQFEPFKGAQRIYHTNHPLINDDKITPAVELTSPSTSNTRLDYLKARLKDLSKKVSIDTIKNILRSHIGPICVHHNNQPNSGYTYSSVIISLNTPPTLYLTIGPPCLTEYSKLTF